MRFFLPYTMLLVATVLFLGTCSGCSRWKDKVDVPAPETISQLKQPAEVKNDKPVRIVPTVQVHYASRFCIILFTFSSRCIYL